MNTPSNPTPESFDRPPAPPAAPTATRPFYWSLRREFWENRSIYLAAPIVAAVYLFGFLISMVHLPAKMRALSTLDAAHQYETIVAPYHFAAGLIMATVLIVGVFYSLDALHGERRDRSILFWKSLPVSDLTTVLAKAAIPIVILQFIAFVVTVATQFSMLLLSSVVLLGNGISPAILWSQLAFFQMAFLLLYHLVTVHSLWHAPIYGWLLLVSGWARRAVFLWAVLPLLAIGFMEKIAFNTTHFAAMLGHRFAGGPEAMSDHMEGMLPIHTGMHLTPGHYLISPGLWIGLAFTALFLAAAVRLRHYRGPI